MKATAIIAAVTLLLGMPLAAQSTDPGPKRNQTRKQDGTCTATGSATASGTQSQLRLRDGSCGNPNPSGTRGAGQGARKGQGR